MFIYTSIHVPTLNQTIKTSDIGFLSTSSFLAKYVSVILLLFLSTTYYTNIKIVIINIIKNMNIIDHNFNKDLVYKYISFEIHLYCLLIFDRNYIS